MADLNNLQAAQTIKIAGSDSSGVETTFVNSTLNGEIKSADILNVTVTQSLLSIGTSATEIKVGASRLVNRKSVQIQAQGTNLVYGYSSGTQIFTIANGETVVLSLGDNMGVWIKRSSGIGNVNVAIAEFA